MSLKLKEKYILKKKKKKSWKSEQTWRILVIDDFSVLTCPKVINN